MSDSLIKEVIDFSQNLKRNIIDLKNVYDVFDDLIDENDDIEHAESLILETRHNINITGKLSDFYYTTAVLYPFETEPFMASRFSDGSFPVWYGSLDLETTIYETEFHMKKAIMDIENIENEGIVVRKRSVFNVYCEGLLIDIRNKGKQYPGLLSDNYSFCQNLGKKLYDSNLPGLLTTSARCGGENASVFNPKVLSRAKLVTELLYETDTQTGVTSVFENRKKLLEIG